MRFAIAKDTQGAIALHYVLEAAYLPAASGILEYDEVLRNWTAPHLDQLIQTKAECFLQSYLKRRKRD